MRYAQCKASKQYEYVSSAHVFFAYGAFSVVYILIGKSANDRATFLNKAHGRPFRPG